MRCRLACRALIVALLLTDWTLNRCSATEMEFELRDNDVQCFYEEIEKGKRCFMEFQVRFITGLRGYSN